MADQDEWRIEDVGFKEDPSYESFVLDALVHLVVRLDSENQLSALEDLIVSTPPDVDDEDGGASAAGRAA